jgi:hypothetical protein
LGAAVAPGPTLSSLSEDIRKPLGFFLGQKDLMATEPLHQLELLAVPTLLESSTFTQMNHNTHTPNK